MKEEDNAETLRDKINDFSATASGRIDALARLISLETHGGFPPFSGQVDSHIHTAYSLGRFTPAMAALRARETGLEVAGSVDHDSLAAAWEMKAACKLLGMGSVTGFELRVSFKRSAFSRVKLNNSDARGLAFMTIQGIPAISQGLAEEFLRPIRAARILRTHAMLESLNQAILRSGIPRLDFKADVEPLAKLTAGGGISERHLLFALALKILDTFQDPNILMQTLRNRMHINVTPEIEKRIRDTANPLRSYDLLGLLKDKFMFKIYIQPDADECIDAEIATSFARAIGAIPSYAFVGDVWESPTGRTDAEKFDLEYLNELFMVLKALGFQAVARKTPTSTIDQIIRVQKMCDEYGMLEISGVTPDCMDVPVTGTPEQKEALARLTNTTWALAAHERLSSDDVRLGLFHPQNPMAASPLPERVAHYAMLGRKGI